MREPTEAEYEANEKMHKDYERRRNYLITDATKYADKRHKKPEKGACQAKLEEYNSKWNRCFHNKMNRLAKEKL